ncbi:MAG: hypothetical protein ACYS26_13955 [Planctomycetota bacterium]|jgi:hypothetical protein
MGTIFFILAAFVVWSIAKSKSDETDETDDQRRLDDLRKRLRQQGSKPLDRPLEPEPQVSGSLPNSTHPASGAEGSERWSAWLDPVDGAAAPVPESGAATDAPRALPSEPPSSAFAPESEPPPLERLRQGLGFPEPAQPEPAPEVSESLAETTFSEAPPADPVATDPEPAFVPEPPPAPEPEREPEPEPIPALSDGAEPADPDAALADRFQRALERRTAAYAERGGPAPMELSISSSLVRPMGDLLSVLVHLAGGGAKHLTAQSRGLPVFGLRLAQPEELTEARLVDALDHLERAHPTLRRGCAERLLCAHLGVGHARSGWTGVLERLVGERD